MEPKRASPSPMACAVSRARAAFTINTTISSHKWRERQLHGLCELLALHREELIQALCEKRSSLRANYEQELAIVLQDIAHHYVSTTKATTPSRSSVAQQVLPIGVSVLLVDSASPFRFLFGSLAANLALGNTVILANNAQSLAKFWLILQREAPRYLDPEAIHVLQGLGLDHGLLEKVDLISIFSEHSEPYKDVLQLPYAQFISTKGGSSLLVVDEGGKSYDKVTRAIIGSYSFRHLRPEAVNAIFIRQTEIDEFRKSFNAMPSPAAWDDASTLSLDQTTAFTRFSSWSYIVELASLVGPGEKELGLSKAIEVAFRAGVLLVITYRSIDHAIDALRRLKPAPKYLTLLEPSDKANLEYFAKWTASQFCSLGSTRPIFLYACGSDVLFPLSLFGRSRDLFSGRQPELEQPLDDVLQKVREVVKLPEKARNQTEDFFQYVNRVATVAGLTLGSLCVVGTYLWYTKGT